MKRNVILIKVFHVFCFVSLFVNTNIGQNLIKGKILDAANNEQVIGATVSVKGTDRGTVTDIDGNFELEAATGNILIVSYTGYKSKEIIVGDQKQYDILLQQDNVLLDQIVVIGYGTQRKVDVTGSAVTIKGEELSKQPVITATQALQGKVAGVQILASGKPGSSPNVRVRGIGTALAGTTALFVVDGVLTDDISNINTSDIVSVDILKDASSTAIYGARGANGVIIISTKKGVSGGTKVNYNNIIGFRSAARIVDMANAEEYANYASAATGQTVLANNADTDWYREILRNAFTQNHNLSISGGSENMSHFVGLGYLDEEGIVLNNSFKRFNIRTNLDYKLSSFVKVGLNGSMTTTNERDVNLGAAYNNAYRATPNIPSVVEGRYGNTSQFHNVGNPVLDLNNNDIRNKNNRIQASAFAEVEPLKKLKFRSMLGADNGNFNGRGYNFKFLNDEITFLNSGGNQRSERSSLTLTNSNSFRWVWDNMLSYQSQWDKHTFNFLLGTTAEALNSTFFSSSRDDVPADKNLWYINTGDPNTTRNNGGGEAWTRNSYLGRVNYNYDDKYLFTGTLRRDGSSRISKDNRWGFFPSFGAGWVLSNENFLKDNTIIETLKLRASWGRVGNDRVPSDAFTVTVTPNLAYPFGGGVAVNGSAITQVKDPNLTWETTEEIDLGLDFSFLKGKLYGELGFYTKTTNDLLINIKLPATAGDEDGVILTNAASIRNTGFEASLNWRENVSQKFSYKIGANITLNNNEVIGLNGGEPILDGGVGAGQIYTTRTDNGQPVGAFYVYQVLGVFQNGEEIAAYKSSQGAIIQPSASPGDFRYQDSNDDGRIDDKDRVFVGSYQPKMYLGLNTEISYGSFDLGVDFYGNAGNVIYNGKKALRLSGLDNVERKLAYDRWSPNSGIQTEPSANAGFLPASTYFVESGDFLRINNVTLNYNISPDLVRKLKISNARIFVTSQNTFTLQRFSGFSPELLDSSPTRAGIEFNAYPTTRTLACGVNFNF
jgi:TonB-dependent starch-binding outer membrane protein SusC